MPLILPGNVASATASTTFSVDNSCRLDGSSAYMHKTPGGAGNLRTFTISFWVKKSGLGQQWMFQQGADNGTDTTYLSFTSADQLSFDDYQSADNIQLRTNRLFRDPGAWYHIVIAVDTTQATDTNRVKMYINGTQETSFALSTYPSQNFDTKLNGTELLTLCSRVDDGGSRGLYYNGYLAEVVMIDGLQLAPTSFGEFDEDSPTIWKPIDVSGLTFGTNGYYLDFEDSSNLGNDANGGTDFTVTNLAAADQSTDTPTNNFCVMNPLDNYYANATLSEGNLKMVSGSSRECSSTATIALSNGKWFWEYEVTTMSAPFGGIQPIPSFGNTASAAVLQTNGLGYLKTGKVETTDGSGGSTELASYATYAANDIIGVALDLDAATNIIYFYKNGALQGSGVNLTHVDSTANGHYLIAFGAISGQDTFEINFGNPITALDSANADANGYGAFEYAVPSGFFSICTKNLAEYG